MLFLGKNSWGAKQPAAIFKFARGTDAANIESMGASWLSVCSSAFCGKTEYRKTATGATNVIGYIGGGHETLALTTKANGFCPDNLLHASLIADPTKVENACVSMSCDGKGKCHILFKSTCPKDKSESTVVEIVADANFPAQAYTGGATDVKMALNTETACITNVYTEDRSGKKAEVAKTEDKADSASMIKKNVTDRGFVR